MRVYASSSAKIRAIAEASARISGKAYKCFHACAGLFNTKMTTCEECKGECCRKLAFHIQEPKSMIDFEDMKWYLYHEGCILYIDNEGDWLVQVPVKCAKLDRNGRCSIYDRRPPICRLSKVEECEKNIDEMKVVFRTVKDLENYMRKKGIL